MASSSCCREGRKAARICDWNVDFHADYRLPFTNRNNARQFSLVLDVLNLFNRHGVMEVDQDYVYEGMPGDAGEDPGNLDAFGNPKYDPSLPNSPYYSTPILWQAPRIVQFGIKFRF
jgi:hypothetical protein